MSDDKRDTQRMLFGDPGPPGAGLSVAVVVLMVLATMAAAIGFMRLPDQMLGLGLIVRQVRRRSAKARTAPIAEHVLDQLLQLDVDRQHHGIARRGGRVPAGRRAAHGVCVAMKSNCLRSAPPPCNYRFPPPTGC